MWTTRSNWRAVTRPRVPAPNDGFYVAAHIRAPAACLREMPCVRLDCLARALARNCTGVAVTSGSTG